MCYCTPSIRTPYCSNCTGYMRTTIEQLQQRIAELESTIKQHGIPVKTYAGGEAHYCTKEEE